MFVKICCFFCHLIGFRLVSRLKPLLWLTTSVEPVEKVSRRKWHMALSVSFTYLNSSNFQAVANPLQRLFTLCNGWFKWMLNLDIQWSAAQDFHRWSTFLRETDDKQDIHSDVIRFSTIFNYQQLFSRRLWMSSSFHQIWREDGWIIRFIRAVQCTFP